MTADNAATGDELAFSSLTGAAALLRAGKVSPVELVRVCLGRIEAHNPVLNAFITVTAKSALQEAYDAEAEMRRGEWRGPLHGIPVAIKDMIDTAGVRTTGASAVYLDRIPGADAAVVSRLRRAGAILLGKLNMQEFAIGGSSVPSHFGAVRNPWDTSRIAGGSSGGSAAAVAAGLCFAALGTDTGGSVRQPAALCGVVGLKPTYGRVSNLGVLPLAPSLDHVGPLTRNVEDCATVLEAIAGYERRDVSSERRPLKLRPWPRSAARVRIGVPRAFFYEGRAPRRRGGARGIVRSRCAHRRSRARREHRPHSVPSRGLCLARRAHRREIRALSSRNARQARSRRVGEHACLHARTPRSRAAAP
jgi:aspartyl-tRNA(Asn)/glutamyl-tRNA(Gln) amidotransferase subunit A